MEFSPYRLLPPVHGGEVIDCQVLAVMFARLMIAAALGALVGYEREAHGRPAGLRTHMLVCMGSTIFTIVSISFAGASPDPSRIASQIVSGIGFLGAGTIIRQGSIVRGLTTAASLWTIAAIGMAVGVSWNLAVFGVIASIVVFVTLSVLNTLEHRLISQRRYRELAVIMKEGEQNVAALIGALASLGADITGVRSEDAGEFGVRLLRVQLRVVPGEQVRKITDALSGMLEISSFNWD